MISEIEDAGPIHVGARAEEMLLEMIGGDKSDVARGRGRPATLRYSRMSPEQQREYKAQKARERRERTKASIEDDGVVPFDAASAREALADAALIILSRDLQGAENIRRYLRGVFASQPGAPMTIEARAKSGKMLPKYLKLTQPKSK